MGRTPGQGARPTGVSGSGALTVNAGSAGGT